ncbi:MAG: hypothetical protein J6Y78_11470 [Paludibacteraceae bacterium]|nr:hypothetical protein [Paludibacteraceae bacterium]
MFDKIEYNEDVKEEIVEEHTYNDEIILKNKKRGYFHITINNIPFMVHEVEVGEIHLRLFRNNHMLCSPIYEDMLLKDEILITI